MSAAVDANVLLFASDSTSVPFQRAKAFLDQRAASAELLCLTWGTVMAYLRIATHPSIFATPLTLGEATANIEALMALPQTRVLQEADGFWEAYREVTGDVPARGNLVPDAHLATILRQHGIKTLYTADRDFRKFSFLDVRDPFA